MSYEDDNKMMKIEDIVNDVVLIVVEKSKGLAAAGIDKDKFYAKVIGFDQFGLWVEHPNFEVIISEDSKGKPLFLLWCTFPTGEDSISLHHSIGRSALAAKTTKFS